MCYCKDNICCYLINDQLCDINNSNALNLNRLNCRKRRGWWSRRITATGQTTPRVRKLYHPVKATFQNRPAAGGVSVPAALPHDPSQTFSATHLRQDQTCPPFRINLCSCFLRYVDAIFYFIILTYWCCYLIIGIQSSEQ